MSEKKMARARELAFEMDDFLTEKIVCLHEASKVDNVALLSRQWTIMFRQKLYDLMDAGGIERTR